MHTTRHHHHRTSPRGFTLVETLVAISILMVAILGPIVIVTQGLQTSFVARDQIVAFYLAQEAIEAVRFQRDNNALAGQHWLTGLNTCVNTDCRVHIGNLPNASFAAGAGLIYFDESPSNSDRVVYSHNASGNTPTPFTRRLRINGSGDQEREVEAVVTWQTSFGAREVRVRTRIFNHYD